MKEFVFKTKESLYKSYKENFEKFLSKINFPAEDQFYSFDAKNTEGTNLYLKPMDNIFSAFLDPLESTIYKNETEKKKIISEINLNYYNLPEKGSTGLLFLTRPFLITLDKLDKIASLIEAEFIKKDSEIPSTLLLEYEQKLNSFELSEKNYRYSITKNINANIIDKDRPGILFSKNLVGLCICFWPEFGVITITNSFRKPFRNNDELSFSIAANILSEYFKNETI